MGPEGPQGAIGPQGAPGEVEEAPINGVAYARKDAAWVPEESGGGGGAASDITFTPAGNIAATTVQAAIVELDTEKVAKAGDTMTGALTLANVAGPSISFDGQPTYGLFLNAGPAVAILAANQPVFSVALAAITAQVPIVGSNGTAGAPAFAFTGQPTTGLYYTSSAINFSVSNAQRLSISTAAITPSLTIRGIAGTQAAPGYSFNAEQSSGLWRKAAGVISMSVVNSEVMNWANASKITTAYGPIVLPADPVNALEAATKQYVDSRPATDSTKVLKAGDTMTGNLTIAPLSTAILILNHPETYGNLVQGQRAGIPRWNLYLGDTTADGGGNTGADFAVTRSADSGTYIDTPIRISRSNGKVQLNGDPTEALHAATKQYVDASAGGARTFVDMGGGRSFDVAVPAGKTLAKFNGIVIPSSATNLVLLMQISVSAGVFLSANSDYAISGFSHTSAVTPTAVSGAAALQNHPGIQMSSGHNVVNYPIHFDGQFIVRRPSTTSRFSGEFRATTDNATNGFTHSFFHGHVSTTNIGSALDILALRFICVSSGDAWEAGSQLTVEWS